MSASLCPEPDAAATPSQAERRRFGLGLLAGAVGLLLAAGPGAALAQAAGTGGLRTTRQALRKARMGQAAARGATGRPDSREEQKKKIAEFTDHGECTAYVDEQKSLAARRAAMRGREAPDTGGRDFCAHLKTPAGTTTAAKPTTPKTP